MTFIASLMKNTLPFLWCCSFFHHSKFFIQVFSIILLFCCCLVNVEKDACNLGTTHGGYFNLFGTKKKKKATGVVVDNSLFRWFNITLPRSLFLFTLRCTQLFWIGAEPRCKICVRKTKIWKKQNKNKKCWVHACNQWKDHYLG